MAAFKVLETQFQKFIKSRSSLDHDDGLMTRKYFLAYTQTEVQQFCDTLIQHMESVKKSVDERALHQRETESRKQDISSSSGNDADADAADIKPVYDKESLAKLQLTAECNAFANDQQHAEQPEFNNEGGVDQNADQCHDTRPLLAIISDNKTTELSNQSLKYENICLKKTVAQFQQDFSILQTHCINLELKSQNNVLKLGQHGKFLNGKSNEVKVKYDIDEIETISIELEHSVAKLLTEIEQNSSKSVSTSTPKETYGLNDMIHNYCLEDVRKKTPERGRNSKTSVMPSARSQSTANGSKQKPWISNQKSRNWPASKSSCVTINTMSIDLFNSKHFVCSTCQKCVFNANHDACVTKLLNEGNSRAMVPSNKTTTRYKLVEQISIAKKPERQIPTGHMFSIKKTSTVHVKTMIPRSCLSTTKVDSESPHGSNTDITNPHECKQTLDLSAGMLSLSLLINPGWVMSCMNSEILISSGAPLKSRLALVKCSMKVSVDSLLFALGGGAPSGP
ncbi:hypothetical protein Tco_0031709 [Tanacetum coccineum]